MANYNYIYVVAPTEKLGATKGRYSNVTDSGDRQLVNQININNIYRKPPYQILKISSKYFDRVLVAWETTIAGSYTINAPSDSSMWSDQDKFLFWPEDFKIKFISCHSIPFTNDIVDDLNRYNNFYMFTPEFNPATDYSKYTQVENMIYFVPVPMQKPDLVRNVEVDGVIVLKRMDPEWINTIAVKPVTEFVYLRENGNTIVVKDRPDIVLLPYDTASPNKTEVVGKVLTFNVLSYFSEATGVNLVEALLRETADKLWLEKFKRTMKGTSELPSKEAELQTFVRDANSFIIQAQQKIAAAQTVKKEIDQINEYGDNLSERKLNDLKMLRSWGCKLDGNLIILPISNLIIACDGNHYKIGDLWLTYDTSRGPGSDPIRVRLAEGQKKLNSCSESVHPHVYSEGNICYGSAANEVSRSLKAGDIPTALMWASQVLKDFNPDSPVSEVSYWPRCDADGNNVRDHEIVQRRRR